MNLTPLAELDYCRIRTKPATSTRLRFGRRVGAAQRRPRRSADRRGGGRAGAGVARGLTRDSPRRPRGPPSSVHWRLQTRLSQAAANRPQQPRPRTRRRASAETSATRRPGTGWPPLALLSTRNNRGDAGRRLRVDVDLLSGTKLEEDLSDLLWPFVNVLPHRLEYLERMLDDNELVQRCSQAEQDFPR